MTMHIILTVLFFSFKGRLATSGLDVRSISSDGDCSDCASDTRVVVMAAGSESTRGSAGGHEKIPRHTEGSTGPGGTSVRAEAAAAEEESESAAAPGEEKFPGAVRHNAQLLLLPAILRNLHCHIQRRRDYG